MMICLRQGFGRQALPSPSFGGQASWLGERLVLRAIRPPRLTMLTEFVYVLHCFQKKSQRGAKTPPGDIALIKSRLRMAEADYKARKEPN
jgi:hypothetical protein